MKKQVNPIMSIASIMAAPANGSMHAINGSTDGTAESADGPYQLIHVTAAASYSDAGLSPYTMYHYLVQAYTGSQFSLPSVPVSAMTPSCGTPVPPCWQCCCPCCGCDPCCCRCNPQNNAIGL